jgi:hypothetical protein
MIPEDPAMWRGVGPIVHRRWDFDHVELMALQLRLFLVTCVTLVPQLEESTDPRAGL